MNGSCARCCMNNKMLHSNKKKGNNDIIEGSFEENKEEDNKKNNQMSYKIISKFIKDISFEIPNIHAFTMLEKEISNYS